MNKILRTTCKKYDRDEWFNDLTDEMDKYNRLYRSNKGMIFRTYLYDLEHELKMGMKDYNPIFKTTKNRDKILVAFRIPGATRGHIELDENHIITDIKFYEDTCFGVGNLPSIYDRKVIDATKKFIGYRIVIGDQE